MMCRKSSNCSHHILSSWEKQFSTLLIRSRVRIMHRCSRLAPESTCETETTTLNISETLRWIVNNAQSALSAC